MSGRGVRIKDMVDAYEIQIKGSPISQRRGGEKEERKERNCTESKTQSTGRGLTVSVQTIDKGRSLRGKVVNNGCEKTFPFRKEEEKGKFT